jgi:hypothetical protein
VASAETLMFLIFYEAAFIFIYGLYSSAYCYNFAANLIPVPDTSGVGFDLFGVLVGIGKLIIQFINGLIYFGSLITGLGINCGFPSWYVSVVQIPILVTIIYLFVPFIK